LGVAKSSLLLLSAISVYKDSAVEEAIEDVDDLGRTQLKTLEDRMRDDKSELREEVKSDGRLLLFFPAEESDVKVLNDSTDL
jgi:hypothetical protein